MSDYYRGQQGPTDPFRSPNAAWQQAFVSAAMEDNHVVALLDQVKEWKCKADVPADIPVLPETSGTPEKHQLVPYAKAAARITLFPGRKQA